MRILEKVIFDTNIIFDKIWEKPWNSEHGKFFGGRDELEKFSKVSDIIFPDIVIEELEYQIKRALIEKKKTFLENPFHWIRRINQEETIEFDIEKHISELKEMEEISYTTIELTDFSIVKKMKDLALKKEAPFAAEDKTDKWFKDAYLYFTILEYLQKITDKYVFVCTKDIRLKEALQKHPNIKIIDSFEKFKENGITSFLSPYFIEWLNTHLGAWITQDDIDDYWINTNDNYVLSITMSETKILVEIDAGEIIGSVDYSEFSDVIDALVNSGNFSTTHSSIEILTNFIQYLTDEEILRILVATTENNQIWWITSDDDVKEFIWKLFESKRWILDTELSNKITTLITE